MDGELRLVALVSLLAAALVLGSSGLIGGLVCVLTLVLILTVGLAVPRWVPRLVEDSPQRTGLALTAVVLLIAATAASGPGALTSGRLSDGLGAAVTQLALPPGVPIGLLAAMAAGALVAVTLELADRRGVQSALVLGTAVFGLASVASPGQHLLPAIVVGWPAAMFLLARLAGTVITGPAPYPPRPTSGRPGSGRSRRGRWGTPGSRPVRIPMLRPMPGGTGTAGGSPVARWQVLPAVATITLGLVSLGLAVAGGLATIGEHRSFGPAGGFGTPFGSRSTSDYLGGDMNLTLRGSLTQDPVLDVPLASPRLWRAGTLDEYSGRGWSATDGPSGRPKFVIAVGSGEARLQGSGSTEGGDTRADEVRSVRSGTTQILAPGQLLSVASNVLAAAGQVYAGPGDQVSIGGGGGDSGRYEVRTRVLPEVDDTAALPTGTGPAVDEALDPRWTELPDTVPDRVLQLGRSLVDGTPSRQAAVRAIEAELAARMTYTLDSPVPAAGADAADDALFVSRSGFCEQFATVEAVLLRAAGVPARIAVGFSGGDPGADGFRTMRRSDAHAWVEVWFPDTGWVTSDPTPASETQSQTWWGGVLAAVRSALDRPLAGLGAGSGAVLVVLVAWLCWRRRADRSTGSAVGSGLDPELAAAFRRLEALLAASGRPRTPNETPSALARRLEHDPDQELAQALLVVERGLYAAESPSEPESRAAAAALDRWRPAESTSASGPASGPASGSRRPVH